MKYRSSALLAACLRPALVLSLFCLTSCAFFRSGAGTDLAWWQNQPENNGTSGPVPAPEPQLRPLQKHSLYLPMRDGTRIAADVYLPADLKPEEKLPAILNQTRYCRSLEYRFPFRAWLDTPPEILRRFVGNGYAWIAVDVRGTGASFGTAPYPWSPKEISDGAEIVDWIVRQKWSNGKVGSEGVSYEGTSADFLLANNHRAVKAIAPRFSLFDAYTDIAFPGGIHLTWFTSEWAKGNRALDNNDFASLLGGASGLAVIGVSPVDGDESHVLLNQAVAEHQQNYDIYRDALTITYRDDRVPAGYSTADISPAAIAAKLSKSNVPIYSYSGWFDGAYAHAAIKRYMSVPTLGSRLTIGPWNHGGRMNISPTAESTAPKFDHVGELLRFFDLYLKGIRGPISTEAPVHYYTLVEDRWKSADDWPPRNTETLTYYFQSGSRLSFQPADAASAPDAYKVSYQAGTGTRSRWRSLYNLDNSPTEYPSRPEVTDELLHYTSGVLPSSIEVTGHPVLTLYLTSTAPDGEIFAYLDDVSPEGSAAYVTEGEFRILHREEEESDDVFHSPTPKHSFTRSAGRLLPQGEAAELRFDLLPTSYLFKKGHRIRLSIAGADKDHFIFIPENPPTIRVYHDRERATRLILPVIPRPENRTTQDSASAAQAEQSAFSENETED